MHFDPSKDIGNLQDRVVVVTGGNSGIGAATIKELAKHSPSCIYLCARSVASGQAVVDEVKAHHPKANIKVQQLDLSSFESINKCATEINQSCNRLHTLILNAGLAGVAANTSVEGYEIHMGVNHLGHALLTQLLMPKLLQTAASGSDTRIVVTTSLMAHRSSPSKGIVLDEVHSPNAFNSATQRYGHSKLANILFARKLSQLYPSITTMSQHPGIVKTEGYSKADGVGIPSWVIKPFLWVSGVSPDKGAHNTLWCATAKVGKEGVEAGKYYEPVGKQVDRNPHANDQVMAEELWEWTATELAKHGGPGWPKV